MRGDGGGCDVCTQKAEAEDHCKFKVRLVYIGKFLASQGYTERPRINKIKETKQNSDRYIERNQGYDCQGGFWMANAC